MNIGKKTVAIIVGLLVLVAATAGAWLMWHKVTYKNKDLGFSLRYPGSFTMVNNQDAYLVLYPKLPKSIPEDSSNKDFNNWPKLSLQVVPSYTASMPLKEFFEQKVFPNLQQGLDHNVKYIKLDGVDAVSYTENYSQPRQNYLLYQKGKLISISYTSGDTGAKVNIKSVVKDFDSIVQSLRFQK